jgi:hypothetical protein
VWGLAGPIKPEPALCAQRLGYVTHPTPQTWTLEVSEWTLYLWKKQALIDVGRAEGVKSFEADELAQAHRTIADLEAELGAVEAVALVAICRQLKSGLRHPGLRQAALPTDIVGFPLGGERRGAPTLPLGRCKGHR